MTDARKSAVTAAEEAQFLIENLNANNAELTRKVEELERANGDVRSLLESAQIATILLDRKLLIRNFTPAASDIFGLRASDLGRPLTDLTSRFLYPDLQAHLERVVATGERTEHQLPRDSRGRLYLARLMPHREGSAINGIVVTLTDVTTLAATDDQQQMLISELNHRVKNMLAVVISIVNNTLENTPSQPAHEVLLGRLHAMARAYGALSRVNWMQLPVSEILRNETEHFGPERFTANGPEVRLEPPQALSLGRVIHELTTNAAKYGALTTPRGSVSVTWHRQGSGLVLEWREQDGPAVRMPETTGFGLSLLEGEIAYRHGGTVETRFEPAGLVARITLPEPR